MIQAQVIWSVCRSFVRSRVSMGEDGSVVETVILTAIFVALAIAVGTLIMTKVEAKANTINLN